MIADYSDVKVTRILNSELADTLGNLLSRCTGTVLNPNQLFPKIERGVFESVAAVDVTAKLLETVDYLPGNKNSIAVFNWRFYTFIKKSYLT